MEVRDWFSQLLASSTDSFVWAVELIPVEERYVAPRPGRWSAARVVFHVVCYEQRIALPTMRQWRGGSRPDVSTPEEDGAREEAEWNDGKGHALEDMMKEFRQGRAEQLALLMQLPASAWQETREAIWKPVSLQWVLTKTYQHTIEHTDEILRAYLWGGKKGDGV
jgi:DinB family protein